MNLDAKSVEEYINLVPEDKKDALQKLRQIFKRNLPQGFKEGLQYGMIAYFVPHESYPKGYHVNPKEPLPFISIAAQKNHLAIYHLGLYMDQALLDWFKTSYQQLKLGKLDMGKSCIRFKNLNKMPYDLIKSLATKMTPQVYIKHYEESRRL